MATKTNLYNLTRDEMESFVLSLGEPRFRTKQIWHWLYRPLVTSFEEMGNLPKALREKLAEHATLGTLTEVAEIHSTDGHTQKWLLDLPDHEKIEAVLMEYDVRNTACISVQVGCAYACAFCATGRMGLIRNLEAGEIVSQIVHVERELRRDGPPEGDHALTNIVFMGMGEPLANYNDTIKAVTILNDHEGLNIGARRMTLSTVGLVPAIRRLAEENIQVNLAVSLHSPIDEIRSELVPINRQYPIAELMDAVRQYIATTGRRITFEYAMINEVNDTPEQAHALGRLIRGMLAHVNLIPLNPVPGSPWPASDPKRIDEFVGILRSYGVNATVRMRRGIDVAAGCGQLYAAVEGRGRSIVPISDYPSKDAVDQVVRQRIHQGKVL
ncbi:MAG: 23S rRNA (adenine(2503)-C(2))-methyltransferase RlmN [Ardenticatenales bacterium]|nr:23S rRNA (adenine(2503)-C(2))-methyltransferase RlmN [Ardenticatenales bacterium]